MYISKLLNKVFLCCFVLFAFPMRAQGYEKANTGAVGDVKYSILNETQFEMVNGPGWVLLDGKKLDQRSALYKLLKETGHEKVIPNDKLPNADGQFLRGKDTDESDDYGDVQDGRIVGSHQKDAMRNITGSFWNGDDGTKTEGAFSAVNGHGDASHHGAKGDKVIFDASKQVPVSNEIRPTNISLYVYIKIN